MGTKTTKALFKGLINTSSANWYSERRDRLCEKSFDFKAKYIENYRNSVFLKRLSSLAFLLSYNLLLKGWKNLFTLLRTLVNRLNNWTECMSRQVKCEALNNLACGSSSVLNFLISSVVLHSNCLLALNSGHSF